MSAREYVDFAHVPPSQWSMHDRLENWARWCRGPSGREGRCEMPMFALHRSTEAHRVYGAETPLLVNRADAVRVGKGVAALPDKHRRALQWAYVKPHSPVAMARELGVRLSRLAALVHDARAMLINRGA